MPFFAWNDELSVGNKSIDDDHRHLIALLRALNDAMSSAKEPAVLGRILSDLITYTDEHFKREEASMRAIDFPEYSGHKDAHDRLSGEVMYLQSKFLSGDAELTVEIMMFLFSWLFEHIMEADKDLGVALRRAEGKALSGHG
jgi:hemerythrin-like metal-binding protein